MCQHCRKQAGERGDAREASARTGIALTHFRHCPDCHQLLTLEEEDSLRRADLAAKATVPED